MDKPTKLLLSGFILAALIATAGYANTHRLENKLRGLEFECVNKRKEDKSEWARFTLVCDANSLENNSGKLKGIQAQIVQVKHQILISAEWPYRFSFIVLLLSASPWLWYFLLRRIRELRDAILGK